MYNNNYYQPMTSQFQMPNRQSASFLKGRPVSSLEEARASAVDFDGSVFYFPDLANRRIYTKQINLDGTATMLMYELKEVPVDDTPSYVTRQEFENTISQILAALPKQNSLPQSEVTEIAPPQEYKF